MSMLVSSVHVAAFGGINSPIQLDLSAPLTLIYAPNGTGKTSLIESVDWLLGGEVREERCKLTPAHEPTEVTLVGTVAAKAIVAKRSLREGRILRVANGVSLGEADFLQALAPECDVSELSPLARIPRLKGFLSSNRVLGVDSLSRLIDSDNADARADAMADLTGTRAQRNAQKTLDIYRKRLRDQLSKLREKLSDLGSRQHDLLALSFADADANALLQEAVRILSATHPTQPFGDEHGELIVRANNELSEINAQTLALEQLRKLLDAPPFGLDSHELEERIAELEAEIKGTNSALTDQAAQFQELKRDADQLNRDAESLHVIIDALLDLIAATKEGVTFRDLKADMDSVLAFFSDVEIATRLLSELIRVSIPYAADQNRKLQLDKLVAAITQELSIFGPREEIERALASKEMDLAKSRESRESFRTLKAEAVRASLLAHQHFEQESDCPACGHDWGSHQRLEDALKGALALLPRAEALLLSKETALAGDIDALQSLLSRRNDLDDQLSQAAEDLERITGRIEEANLLARRFGFESVAEVSDSTTHEWQRRLESARAFIAFERIRAMSHIILRPLSDHTPRHQVDSLKESATTFRARAAEKQLEAEEVVLAMGVAEAHISRITPQLSKLRAQHAETQEWNRRVTRLQKVLGLRDLSMQHLDEIEKAISHRSFQVRAAITHLDAVRDLETKSVLAREAERASHEAEVVTRDIELIEAELARIGQVNERLESQSEHHRRRLIETVGPSVSQLFQRMQVNRVFNSVTVSASFELMGLLDEHALKPEVFSTGQRQDLALAFFLVRAYALGGSFFLDEPLAHLDDLNRVAVLDTLRAFVLSGQRSDRQTRLVLTTASWTTTRHVIQKFMRISRETPLLRAYQLTGNVSSGVGLAELFPSSTLSSQH